MPITFDRVIALNETKKITIAFACLRRKIIYKDKR